MAPNADTGIELDPSSAVNGPRLGAPASSSKRSFVDIADSDSEPGPGARSSILGLHHVRIPVSDPWVSRDWYGDILGFKAVLDLEEEERLVGVVLRHPQGIVIGLHRDPQRSAILKDFALLGLTVLDREHLAQWACQLDRLKVSHRPIEEGHLGWYLDIIDPDGILVRLHTGIAPDAEEA
jgi:catechol 2,3-dioxygenase-like lactoylglutathione lyase family enzyme